MLISGLSVVNSANAIPGIGGTITKDCTYRLCVSNCFTFGIDMEGVPFSLEGGGEYETFEGTERSCGEQFKMCSFDLSCS